MVAAFQSVLLKRSVVMRSSWANKLNAKDIHKEMFPLYGGKCLSCKTIDNWAEKFSEGRSKVANDARLVRRWLRRICCGFRGAGKALGQVYQCWWRICQEIHFFPGSSSTCFAFYIHLWPIY
jgi:hypothetical protein